MDEEVLRELRVQTSILRIAFRGEIEAVGDSLRKDSLAAAIIEALSENGSMRGGALWEQVLASCPGSVRRTFNRRLSSLGEAGVVSRSGAGSGSQYELTGLIQ